jgi:hypothetical protein
VATAAADFRATRQVSPELVLVDAALAEELRPSLDTPPASTAVALHVVSITSADLEPETVVVGVAPLAAESSSDVDTSDLIVGAIDGDAVESETRSAAPSPSMAVVDSVDDNAGAAAPDYGDTSDLIVRPADDATHGSEATSRYPALPAPEDAGVDPMDAAEAALREIRARMTTDAPETRRLFRTRFTVAMGGSAVCAAAALVAHVHYGIAQLPI